MAAGPCHARFDHCLPAGDVGHVGLTALVLASAGRRLPTRLRWADILAIALHVCLAWVYRYRWRLGQTTRNGWARFLVFQRPCAGGRGGEERPTPVMAAAVSPGRRARQI